MTPRQRLLTALRRGQPDRVPVTIYELSPLVDDWANREPSYAPLIDLEAEYGDPFVWPPFDLPLLLGPREHHRRERLTESDGTIVTTTTIDTPRGPLRCRSRRSPDLMTGWQIEPLIKDDADIERVLSIPEPPPPGGLDQLAALHAEIGERGLVCINTGDTIGHVVGLFEYGDFALRCVRDEGPIRALLDKTQPLLLRGIHAFGSVLTDVPFRLWGPEYCGKPLLNPRRFFAPYVVEYDRALTKAIHATGNLSVIHCHGLLDDLLEMILETGADALEPIETLPSPTGDVTMAEVKRRIGHRMCLMGGIQATTLENGSPADMAAEVRQCIDQAAAGGGFVILPTSSPFMLPLTDRCLANARAMYQTAHAYGQYP